MITNDTKDTIFVNELQPKPTPGYDYGRSSLTSNTDRFPGFPLPSPANLLLYRRIYNSDPHLIFMKGLGYRSHTMILPEIIL